MKIEKDKVVALAYELEVEGKIADKATKEEPLDYIHGNNVLLPALEVKIEGMSEGDTVYMMRIKNFLYLKNLSK